MDKDAIKPELKEWIILPGRRLNQSMTPVKSKENRNRANCGDIRWVNKVLNPISNGTVTQRGAAKKGPIVKYKRQVNKKPNRGWIRELRSNRP